MKEITLTGGASNARQSFTSSLNGREITFTLYWCGYVDSPFWNLDLTEAGKVVVSGLVLHPGVDLLAPYQLGLGRLIFVGKEATLDNLGERNHLVYLEPDE